MKSIDLLKSAKVVKTKLKEIKLHCEVRSYALDDDSSPYEFLLICEREKLNSVVCIIPWLKDDEYNPQSFRCAVYEVPIYLNSENQVAHELLLDTVCYHLDEFIVADLTNVCSIQLSLANVLSDFIKIHYIYHFLGFLGDYTAVSGDEICISRKVT